ncbi:MAG: hypothetical protein EOO11_20970, partial [Chitinophagaceae bacterium]
MGLRPVNGVQGCCGRIGLDTGNKRQRGAVEGSPCCHFVVDDDQRVVGENRGGIADNESATPCALHGPRRHAAAIEFQLVAHERIDAAVQVRRIGAGTLRPGAGGTQYDQYDEEKELHVGIERQGRQPRRCTADEHPFLFCSMPLICHNGRFVDATAPVLDAANPAFKWGEGLFETMRMQNGTIPLAARHGARLQEGLERLGLNAAALQQPVLENLLEELARRNDCSAAARLRLQVYRDGGGLGFVAEATPL